MSTRTNARQAIAPRLARWAAMLDRYGRKEYFTVDEEAQADRIALQLRDLSKDIKP